MGDAQAVDVREGLEHGTHKLPPLLGRQPPHQRHMVTEVPLKLFDMDGGARLALDRREQVHDVDDVRPVLAPHEHFEHGPRGARVVVEEQHALAQSAVG